MSRHLGFYNTSSTRTHVRFGFSTHAAAGGNVAPNSAFEAADLRIYKATDGAALSATQRSSAAGITMTSPFDSLTGVHTVDIDLTDNTDSGFYASSCYYEVWLCPDETVDSQTITGICLASFEIGVNPVNVTQWLGTAAATPTTAGVPEVDVTHLDGVAAAATVLKNMMSAVETGTAQAGSGTTITLATTANATDDYYNDMTVVIVDGTGVEQVRRITDYVGSTRVATVATWVTNPDNTSVYQVLGRIEGA